MDKPDSGDSEQTRILSHRREGRLDCTSLPLSSLLPLQSHRIEHRSERARCRHPKHASLHEALAILCEIFPKFELLD